MAAQPVLGVDVTALTVAEAAVVGIVLVPEEIHLAPGAPAWRTHSEYAGLHPRHDDMARSYARGRAAAHFKATGGIEGLRLQRTFPCLGTFRELEDNHNGAHALMVQCDVCGEELAVLPPSDDDDDSAGATLASVVIPAMIGASLALRMLGVHQ